MKTILLLDDDESILSVFGMALRRNGYRVIEASSGDEGLKLAREHLPDLILSDISMPGTDGQDVLREIRLHPELGCKQVVLMTGQTHLVTPRRGMELGADDFLVKPISLDDLLHCVEARLQRAQIHWRVEDQLLSRLRSSLQSTLPHELFTPLGGIIGLAEILQSDFPNLTPEEMQELIRDIHQSGLRLHRTLRNYLAILDFQNNPDGNGQHNFELLPRDVQESIQLGIQASANRHDRAADFEIELEPCSILSTAGDLSLMAEEIADNACKFSRKGTLIKVHLSADAVFTVSDAGRGMTLEEIKQVGLFQQFDRKKQEQQGLGLGLALVQKLAARAGATFLIESEISVGTTVKIAFVVA